MNKLVIPAKAGIHADQPARRLIWIPAFAGMTLLSACTQAGLMGSDKTDYNTSDSVQNKVGPNGELISPENCPNWTASPITTYGNAKQGNFGCATVTNLGLMLEDPRDLERGASGGKISPDSNRSVDAIKNYRKGLSVTVIGTPGADSSASSSSVSGQ